MLKNYFQIAWRNLVRNKVYSSINIVGLAIGLAVCMLIMLYVAHESSYDRFHKNAERICWIQGKIKIGNDSILIPGMGYAAAPVTKATEPSVESFVRLITDDRNTLIQNPESPSHRFAEDKFLFADSNFFSFFSFPLIQGKKQQVLQNPFTVVISKKIAEKYFGSQNPVGKIIRYNNAYNFTITGIAEKAPSNSSIDFDFVASSSSLSSITEKKSLIESQTVHAGMFATYFLLKDSKDIGKLARRLAQLYKTTNKDAEFTERYIATPLIETHLNANYTDDTNTKYLKIFPFVAALILLLALTNYMSLSTARFTTRAKEIGVRKVIGAGRYTIAMQFFIESAVYTAIAFFLGYALCIIFQPVFFNLLQLNIDNSFLYHPYIFSSFLALFIITVLLAATYPSLLLSAYKPVLVLYGKFNKQSSGIAVRKFFTVFQFTISVVLIICGLIISKQMYFFRHTDTGVNRENIVMIPFSQSIGKHYTAFRKETESLPAVGKTATAHYPMYKAYEMNTANPKNSQQVITMPIFFVDAAFIQALGLQWKTPPIDSLFYLKQNMVILNEAAKEKLNLGDQPVNEKINLADKQYEVAGVLKNFNYLSLHSKIEALSLIIKNDTASIWRNTGGCLFAKLKPNVNTASVINQFKTIYEKYDMEKPFEYHFMDEAFDSMYKAEDRLSKIFNVFTFFTVFIACIGLFGLTTFAAQQRTKEIGIRKVLGASVKSIVSLLSKDFVKLVLLAISIASPVAWYFMNEWLKDFAYRTNISWQVFALAGLSALLIALITVSFQAIKAAIANPVKSLRSE